MRIQTQRLILRPVTMADLHTMHAYAGNLENARLMINLPTETLDETRTVLETAVAEWQKSAPATYDFAIELDRCHIGGITIYIASEDRMEGELGWILHRDYWNRGYVSEAAQAIVDFARKTLGMRRLFAQCDARNIGSYRVMEHLGFVLVDDSHMRINRASSVPSLELTYEMYL